MGVSLVRSSSRRQEQMRIEPLTLERLLVCAVDDQMSAEGRGARLCELAALAGGLLSSPQFKERRPFHWPLAFPEVFSAPNEGDVGFHAFIGNPPFLGGQKIT